MNRRSILLLGLTFPLAACGRGAGFVLDDVDLADARSMQDQTQALINALRMQNNRAPLAVDQALVRAADTQNINMLRRQKLKHEFGRSTRFNKRLADAGVRKRIAAENIAVGQFGVRRVMGAWIDSAPHRKNMLIKDIDRFGIAMRVGPNGKRWWTLIVAG